MKIQLHNNGHSTEALKHIFTCLIANREIRIEINVPEQKDQIMADMDDSVVTQFGEDGEVQMSFTK